MTAIVTPQAWYLKAKEIYPVPVKWVRAQYQEAGSGKLLKGSSPYVLGPLASNGSRPSLSLLPRHPSSQSLLSQCSSHGFLICFILGAVVIWFRNLGPDLNPGWVYLEMLNFIFIKIRFSDIKKTSLQILWHVHQSCNENNRLATFYPLEKLWPRFQGLKAQILVSENRRR